MIAESKRRIIAIIIVSLVLVASVWIYAGSLRGPIAEDPAPTNDTVSPKQSVIGKSVEGRNIDLYIYGSGDKHLLFVGGIHGGYEWNSVLLAYTFMDYLKSNPTVIPDGITVSVIPDANPDAVYSVTGREGRFEIADVATDTVRLAKGRFNADAVDLNRNFDCKWQAKSTWQSKQVSGGQSAFSEPESVAIRDFVEQYHPDAAVFWHSQSNAVYASQCQDGILPVTRAIMNAYSKASGYPAVDTFGAYVTTGAADDWLASIGIPAITVELKTHEAIEWDRNLAGVKALFEYYSAP